MRGCCGDEIPSCDSVFDTRTVDADLREFRRDGPPRATRELIDGLAAGLDLEGATVLDVGAGVGAVHLGLLARGAAAAVDVDGSRAYLAAAQDEAERRGVGSRVRHVLGDLTVVRSELDQADLVALDRVICCYADARSLLTAAAGLARRRLALVYPRDSWWIRMGVALANPVMFRRSAGYRMQIHRVTLVEQLLEAAGFAPRTRLVGRIWRVEVWERAGSAPVAAGQGASPEAS